MLTISVKQPWAELILKNKKRIEVRKSTTAHRGILVIQAANIIRIPEFKKANIDPRTINDYQRKALVGVVDLIDIVRLTDSLWEELRVKHLIPGKWLSEDHKYAWILENPRRIKPISYIGMPRFFQIDEKSANQIIQILKELK